MPRKNLRILLLLLAAILLSTAGFSCKLFTSSAVLEASKPIELVYWRTGDESVAFTDIISAYHEIHPNITVTYKKFRPEEYEQGLLNGWAEDKGPDIFSIPNNLIGKYQTKITPLPKEITVPYLQVTGTIKKETTTILKTTPSLTLKDLRNNFVDAAYDDAVKKDEAGREQIYGLPLSVDSLAMFYNKDLLNSARIAQPPTTWIEFQDSVKKLTLLDRYGNVIQSGAALGTANNVDYGADFLSLLMMQNGAQMIDEYGRASFGDPAVFDRTYYPSHEAMMFYTDFSDPTKEVYCWDSKMPDSLSAFIQGKTAFFFGYSSDIATIKAQAPKLNFDIASMPQIEGSLSEMSYARYDLETVSKKTAHSDEAWDFIQFATSGSQVPKYLNRAGRPTAIRGLIQAQLSDFDLGIFAQQSLIAKNWYHGKDYGAVETIFKDMIAKANGGLTDVKKIIDEGVRKVNQTL